MAYITPNTLIKIYNDVPLDNTYDHTLYFPSIYSQNAYFHNNNEKYVLSNYSYQRVEANKIRVERKAEDLYDCNYLAFQNTSYGSKWFYAFIISVEYINDITSEITFEIDVMQTYMFDVDIKECFVEREHSSTDEIGDNIQPEPVSIGELINSDHRVISGTTEMCVIIMVTSSDSSLGNLYDGIYGGCDMMAFNDTDTTSITTYLERFIEQPDQIVAMYMCPKLLVGEVNTGGKHLTYGTTSISLGKILDSVSEMSQDFDGYTPKNKKLYTYPYNFLRIDNASGQSLNLRFEFFDNLTPSIQISGTFVAPVKLILRPRGYKGLPSQSVSTSEFISLEGYPMCSWAVDSFKAWLAQMSIPIGLNAISSVAGTGIASQYSRHPEGTIATGGIGMVANLLSQAYTASIMADQCRGNTQSGNVNVSRGLQNFYSQRCHLTKDYAIVIDNFFNMFGYATNRVKRPNTHVRKYWTYTKTVGCVAEGSAPSTAINKICSIYDKGITFWRNPLFVGEYSLTNDIQIDAQNE